MVIRTAGAITHIHLTAQESGELASAIIVARPQGSAATASGAVVVHVHAEAATPGKAHEPVEER